MLGEGGGTFYLWPDNVQAWTVFLSCATQWRHGTAGRTGLDYGGVDFVMRKRLRIRPRRCRELWPLVAAAESGYLRGLAERAAERRLWKD